MADFKSVEELYKYVTNKEKNFGVIEEVIVQHPDAARIYPPSLNCLRIVTLVKDNVPHLVYAVFKTGNNGNVVDNLESGGLAAKFDMEKAKSAVRVTCPQWKNTTFIHIPVFLLRATSSHISRRLRKWYLKPLWLYLRLSMWAGTYA